MAITGRVIGPVIILVGAPTCRVGVYIGPGQHRHPLLFERCLVLVLDRFVDNILEHLNDEEEEDVHAVEQGAVLAIGLAVGDKHPKALHDPALHDHRRRVPVVLVPDVLRNLFHQLEVPHVGVEGAGWILSLGFLGQMLHCPLVVGDEQSEEVVEAIYVERAAVKSHRLHQRALTPAVALC